MAQIARNVTMANVGFLRPGQYLIHDRDGKFCPAFRQTVEAVGVKPLKLPPRSPNHRGFAALPGECLLRRAKAGLMAAVGRIPWKRSPRAAFGAKDQRTGRGGPHFRLPGRASLVRS